MANMGKKIIKTDDVFGVMRTLPPTYVKRNEVDDVFIECISRKRHIVLYGGSKQGKTCLRKKNINENDYILITCQNNWDIGLLNRSILKQAGYDFTVSATKSIENRDGFKASLSGSVFGIKPKVGVELGENHSEERLIKPIEVDLYDANDILYALDEIGFKKIIVLEDFHYLSENTQFDVSTELKKFYDDSDICFIVVGVWMQEDRLTSLNGDLSNRIIPINVNVWTKNDLTKVISIGEKLLNVEFSGKIKSELILNSHNCVFFLQELCNNILKKSGIYQAQRRFTVIDYLKISPKQLARAILERENIRFMKFLHLFSEGDRDSSDRENEVYKWIIYALLNTPVDKIERGVRLEDIYRIIRENNYTINRQKLSMALAKSAQLQNQGYIRPPIVDYDRNRAVLKVVDGQFPAWLDSFDLPNNSDAKKHYGIKGPYRLKLLRELDMPL